jgi:hypothetical protein
MLFVSFWHSAAAHPLHVARYRPCHTPEKSGAGASGAVGDDDDAHAQKAMPIVSRANLQSLPATGDRKCRIIV